MSGPMTRRNYLLAKALIVRMGEEGNLFDYLFEIVGTVNQAIEDSGLDPTERHTWTEWEALPTVAEQRDEYVTDGQVIAYRPSLREALGFPD